MGHTTRNQILSSPKGTVAQYPHPHTGEIGAALRLQTELHLIHLVYSTLDQAESHGALKGSSCPPCSLPAFSSCSITIQQLSVYHGSLNNRMAVGKTMDITMTLGSFFRFISLVLLLVPATGARYLIEGASTTSPGLMPVDGISPRPTPAPEWNRAFNELRRRADSIISPAPPNWCGFVDGDYSKSEISILCSFWLKYEIILAKSDLLTNSRPSFVLRGRYLVCISKWLRSLLHKPKYSLLFR